MAKEDEVGVLLQRAALNLFRKHGYDRTTAAEIASHAGVTERTFFRHFSDKPEVLFGGEARLRAALTARLDATPGGLAPLETLFRTFRSVQPLLKANRAFAKPRQKIISATPALAGRERARAGEAGGLGGRARGRPDRAGRFGGAGDACRTSRHGRVHPRATRRRPALVLLEQLPRPALALRRARAVGEPVRPGGHGLPRRPLRRGRVRRLAAAAAPDDPRRGRPAWGRAVRPRGRPAGAGGPLPPRRTAARFDDGAARPGRPHPRARPPPLTTLRSPF